MKTLRTGLLAAAIAVAAHAAIAAGLLPITPHLALSNRGRCVTVTGMGSLREDPQRLGFDLDLDGKDSAFLGYIPRDNESQFPDIKSFDGQKVDVTGVIEFYHGRAEIKMTSARQLRLASPEDQSNGLTFVGPEFQKFDGASAVCG